MTDDILSKILSPTALIPQPVAAPSVVVRNTRQGVIRYAIADAAVMKKMEEERAIVDNRGGGKIAKSLLNMLDGNEDSLERLAFERDPSRTNEYASVYRTKLHLIPDYLLKRIAIQDSLVAAILNTRSNQMAAFGRPQPNRFETGFKIEVEESFLQGLGDVD